MNRFIAVLLVLSVVRPALAQAHDVIEPKSGAKFAAKDGDTSLLGVGLRTKTILKVKVYAIGLYVADSAASGPLKGKFGSAVFYRELVSGDFKKMVVMKFLRDVSTDQIRDAWREVLKGAGGRADAWIGYFNDIRSGQECVIDWTPGVGLETKVAGVDKPAINDKAFATAVFGIWLGDKPIQEDIKKDLIARGAQLLK
jgi:chalcone isomerase-like protein